MSQLSSTQLLLEQVDAIMDEHDAEELFFSPSRGSASSPSSGSHLARDPQTPVTTPRKERPRNKTLTPSCTSSGDVGSLSGPSSAVLVGRALPSSATRPTYPTKWTKGHDHALIIFAASQALLNRQHLYKVPFLEPWSGYGWSHLSNHLRQAMRKLLRDQGCDFELPNMSKGSSGGGNLPDEVVQAMENAVMGDSGGSTSPATPITPKRRPIINTSSRSPCSKQSSTRRQLTGGHRAGLKSDEDDLPEVDSTASSAALNTPPPPRSSRPRRSAAGKRSAALLLKGITSSDDEEETQLCLGLKKRRRCRAASTDSGLDELWETQTPRVDASSISKRRTEAQRSAPRSVQTPVTTPTRPSARPLVKTPNSSPARPLVCEQPASQQSAGADAMCIDLTLSEED